MRRSLYVAAIAALSTLGCSDATTAVDPYPPLTDLPPDLAAMTFTAEGKPSSPYVMLEVRSTPGFSGFVIVNGAGEPVWFFRTQGTSSSFSRRANGNFVFLDGDRGLFEVTPAGEVVHQLAQQTAPGRRIHHDQAVTSRNTILFIAEDWQTLNGTTLEGEALWEWDPEAGTTTKRWSSFTHLDTVKDWAPRSIASDWLHANSVSFGPDGNVLISFHFLNQVISLSPDFASVQWRLGGLRATVPVDDPFTGQHTAQHTRADRVLLFDNGYERTTNPYARAGEYEIRGSSAVKIWEWRPPNNNWARIISGVRRLPNGNSMIAFGTSRNYVEGATGPVEAYEVTAAGNVVWHLTVGGAISAMYRATPIDDL